MPIYPIHVHVNAFKFRDNHDERTRHAERFMCASVYIALGMGADDDGGHTYTPFVRTIVAKALSAKLLRVSGCVMSSPRFSCVVA